MAETSYRVLYRKYRPQIFGEVIGQNTIVTALKRSVKNSTFAHAYVFTGPRGTGKTSTAKIMAKAINCESPIDGEPCGKCQSCINFKTSPDIIEIDAASNNGVDEIRELRTNIALAPSSSKYKVYIIDEVHMLSAGAFNALLKTLEEPPSHVVFILATTEVYKIPITILSRCQRLDFKKISENDMTNYLKIICQKEKINCTEEALDEIYNLSEGCLRDALSILDQLLKSSSEINMDTVLERYELISTKTIDELLSATKNGNVKTIIETIDQLMTNGYNVQRLIRRLIVHIEKECINIKLKNQKKYSYQMLKKLIFSLNELYTESRINDNTYTMLKIAFLDSIEDEIKHENVRTTVTNQPKQMGIIDIRINNCFVEANKQALKQLLDFWNNIDKKTKIDIDINEYKPVASSGKYAIFVSEDESLVDLFNIKKEQIENFFQKSNMAIKVISIVEERWMQEKNKYKENIKRGVKYNYVDEPMIKPKEEDETIKQIFDDEIVEVS